MRFDDSRHPLKNWRFLSKNLASTFFQESCVLEELGIFEHRQQILRRKSLPAICLVSLYDPWRREEVGQIVFAADLAPQMTFILNRFGCFAIFKEPNGLS